jgi:hypothetical protein
MDDSAFSGILGEKDASGISPSDLLRRKEGKDGKD